MPIQTNIIFALAKANFAELWLAELWRRVGERAGTTRPRFSFVDQASRHRGNLAGRARGPGPTPSPSAPDEGRGHTTFRTALFALGARSPFITSPRWERWERETGAPRWAKHPQDTRHSKAADQVSSQRLCLRPLTCRFLGRHPSGVGRYGFCVPPFRSKKGNARSDRWRICAKRAVAQTAFLWRSTDQRVRGRSPDLSAEAKVHDVAVGHDVILALKPHFTGIPRAGLTAASDIVIV